LLKKFRELGNHTTRLPNAEVEAQLPGAIFDPYVRFIVWEGIREWWRDEAEKWIACPAGGDPYPHSSLGSYAAPREKQRGAIVESAALLAAAAGEYLPDSVWTLVRPLLPLPASATEGFEQLMLANTPLRLAGEETTHPACPYTWSVETHQINCALAWPKEYHGTPIELDTPHYIGAIDAENLMERLLAQGGLRLAKILNVVLGDGELSPLYFPY
jgi:hypothetical protein